ncbi:MAG: hypothetical protein ACK4K7_15665 [Allosphingosinicella sp.]|uniref:glucosamine inositolphosphorylceramide transferase family protein n=1 Tax=Allosphingosinicella sp. TaxID=2823234 RepID=UPI003952557E
MDDVRAMPAAVHGPAPAGWTPALLSRVRGLARRDIMWSTALYDAPADYRIGDPLSSPAHLFHSKSLWRGAAAIASRADPFLWAEADALYIFLEAEPRGADGRIEAWRTADLSGFEFVGEVLREPHHLSYPFVFGDGDARYLVPESAAAGGVFLYEFEDFPRRPVRRRALLKGRYTDSSLIRENGLWYLFTTSPVGLEIHFAEDLVRGAFRPHPMNPITSDKRYSRSGGGVLRTAAGLVRLAQDCSTSYGANLNLLAVDRLTPDAYAERPLAEHIFPCADWWNRLGVHHLSVASFGGRTVVAIDGKQKDYARGLRTLADRLRGLITA